MLLHCRAHNQRESKNKIDAENLQLKQSQFETRTFSKQKTKQSRFISTLEIGNNHLKHFHVAENCLSGQCN